MRFSLLVLSSLAFLTGCPDEVTILPAPGPHPAPAPAPKPIKLESGTYSMLITGIQAVDCDGMRAGDLVGLKLPLSLSVVGHGATGDLAGLSVAGEMSGGVLYLEGSEENVVYTASDEQSDDEDEASPPPADEDQGENSKGGSSSGSSGSGGSSSGSTGSVEPDPDAIVIGLELSASNSKQASGIFSYDVSWCHISVDVVAAKMSGGHGGGPVVAETESEESEESEGGCGDTGADCG